MPPSVEPNRCIVSNCRKVIADTQVICSRCWRCADPWHRYEADWMMQEVQRVQRVEPVDIDDLWATVASWRIVRDWIAAQIGLNLERRSAKRRGLTGRPRSATVHDDRAIT